MTRRFMLWILPFLGFASAVKAADAIGQVNPYVTGITPNNPTRMALENLVNKIEEIEADKSFQSIWANAYIHGYQYTGPNFQKELDEAKRILELFK